MECDKCQRFENVQSTDWLIYSFVRVSLSISPSTEYICLKARKRRNWASESAILWAAFYNNFFFTQARSLVRWIVEVMITPNVNEFEQHQPTWCELLTTGTYHSLITHPVLRRVLSLSTKWYASFVKLFQSGTNKIFIPPKGTTAGSPGQKSHTHSSCGPTF